MTDDEYIDAIVLYFSSRNRITAIKNRYGEFMGASKEFKKILGFGKGSVVGLTELDLKPEIAAFHDEFRKQDSLAMRKDKTLHILDVHKFEHGYDAYITTKTPLFAPTSGNVFGVGIKLTRAVDAGVILSSSILEAICLNSKKVPIDSKEIKPIKGLSEKMEAYMFFIAIGYTNKEIAVKLNVSIYAAESASSSLLKLFSLKDKKQLRELAKKNGYDKMLPRLLIRTPRSTIL